jgi:hypothetical protein
MTEFNYRFGSTEVRFWLSVVKNLKFLPQDTKIQLLFLLPLVNRYFENVNYCPTLD